MKTIKSLFFGLLFSIAPIFIGCGEQNDYQENRMSSVFPLRQLVQQTEVNKSSTGRFLLFFATYQSHDTKTDYVKMFAKVNGHYRLISAPIEHIRININDSLAVPTLQIRYEGFEQTDEAICNGGWYKKAFIISCPEKYLPEKLLPIAL